MFSEMHRLEQALTIWRCWTVFVALARFVYVSVNSGLTEFMCTLQCILLSWCPLVQDCAIKWESGQ